MSLSFLLAFEVLKRGTALQNPTKGERFFCPFPGCTRSFAELWRLKVHYRAPQDVRGSGKERGHGQELGHCPRCQKTLVPGKHHVGCSGRQAQEGVRFTCFVVFSYKSQILISNVYLR